MTTISQQKSATSDKRKTAKCGPGTFRAVLKALPGSLDDIARKAGLHRSTAKKAIRELRAEKSAHIAEYDADGNAIFASGNKPDARRRPKPTVFVPVYIGPARRDSLVSWLFGPARSVQP